MAYDPAAYTDASQSIDSNTSELVRQLAALRAQAATQGQQYTQNLSLAGGQAGAALNADVAGVARDLAAQGVSNLQPVTDANNRNQYQLLVSQNNQQNYLNALNAANQDAINRIQYGGLQVKQAADANLGQTYGDAIAQDALSGGGGGGYGYGGGGYGGYGSSGSDILTAGDAALVSDLAAEPYNDNPVTSDVQEQVGNRPLDTLLADYLYGTGGQGDEFVKGGFGHINEFGTNAAALASKYARYAKAKFGKDWTDSAGNHHKAVDKKTLSAFVSRLRQEQRGVQANRKHNHAVKVKQRQDRVKAELRGLDVPHHHHKKH